MPFPPKGLKAVEHPLKHKFTYSTGLSAIDALGNSVWFPLVKNYKGVTDPSLVHVNPHHVDYEQETGAICAPMSIIDKLTVTLKFNKGTVNDGKKPLLVQWTPFFCSFGEKYDATDMSTTTSMATVMQLTKDATQEDITPLTTTNLPGVGNTTSDLPHPVSTVNFTEVFGTLNMTTDLIMEETPFDKNALINLIKFGTNKGAIKACLGRTRSMTLDANHVTQTYHIRKFVPRAIRRIVPYTFFGILCHVPVEPDIESYYQEVSWVANKQNVGIKCIVSYDEWNIDHDNTEAFGT